MAEIMAYRCEIDLSPGSAMAPATRAAGEIRFCMCELLFCDDERHFQSHRLRREADPVIATLVAGADHDLPGSGLNGGRELQRDGKRRLPFVELHFHVEARVLHRLRLGP